MDAGTFGGIIGGVIGFMGGAVGTYLSIKNTAGPRERQFMVRSAIVIWIAVTTFVVLLLVLRSPYRWLMWIPYAVAVPVAIISLNRKQQAIRSEEQRTRVLPKT
jgi:Ca2+/Na+ antiporter